MKNNFLIIGVGGIGFRHFQSLNKLKNINLHLVDPKIKFIKKHKIKNEINQKNSYYYYKNIQSILKKNLIWLLYQPIQISDLIFLNLL